MSYKPHGKTKIILDRAMEHIQSVEYKVGLRWVFYRLLQEGLYNKKRGYGRFIRLSARARKNWYDDWHPAILADDTRAMHIFRGKGERPNPDISRLIEQEIQEAIEAIEYHKDQFENYEHECSYPIDPNWYHGSFCIIMFEARAMTEQFRAYTEGLTLCPFGGAPSIPYKWEIAKYIENKCVDYEKSALVFYYGDLDKAGFMIFEAAKEDISAWCEADIEFIHCGLNEEQVMRYGIPENPDNPGGYQWEALDDWQAKEIIEGSLKGHYTTEAPLQAENESAEIEHEVNTAVNEYLDITR